MPPRWNLGRFGGQVFVMEGGEASIESDGDLINRSLDSPHLFAAIFERHARRVHRYLASQRISAHVDDLLSETFVIAFSNRSHFDSTYTHALPWLLGIARNVLRHHLRSETRRLARQEKYAHCEETHDPSEQVVDGIDSERGISQVAQALHSLGEDQRDVILLVGDLGLTYEEAAHTLGIPVGTVRSRLARARSRLRELLELDGQYNSDRTLAADQGLTE